MDDRPAPALNPAQQERSRKTERAITGALSALLRDKSFVDITVAEIARAAQVSTGGFYARFHSKEALLELVELRILEEFNQAAARALDPARFTQTGLPGITQAYAELMVTSFRARSVEIVQILRFTRPHSATEQLLRKFNEGVHERMRALLLECKDQIVGDDVLRTINLGLFFAGAAAREAVLTRNLSVYPVRLSDEQLAREIGAAFRCYLTGGPA